MLDYTVSFDQALGVFTTFASEIEETSYTVIGLTQGLYYTFRVLARNAYGESLWSETVTILAAQIPDAPISPATFFDEPNVVAYWTAPDARGSAILGYRIYF